MDDLIYAYLKDHYFVGDLVFVHYIKGINIYPIYGTISKLDEDGLTLSDAYVLIYGVRFNQNDFSIKLTDIVKINRKG